MRVGTAFAMAILCCTVAFTAMAAPPDADSADIAAVLKTMRGGDGISAPRKLESGTGFLRFLGAPLNASFATESHLKGAATAEDIAKGFISKHGRAFGILSPEVDLATVEVMQRGDVTYVHTLQTYSGLPVFGSAVNVQLDSAADVSAVLADIMLDTDLLDTGALVLVPSIAPSDAQADALAPLKAEHGGLDFAASEPELVIYDPAVVGSPGLTRVAWDITVYCLDSPFIKDRLLVDAHTGEVAFRYPLVHDAKNRQIYDSNNTSANPGTLVRAEGDDELSGITDVDLAYEFYGDTYDFYYNEHGRDSINNAGMTMSATVRYCPYGETCPYDNAFWNGSRMFFGEGWVADDIVAHELTHGVTQWESNLVYAYESGAINESFSDIWGEFVDLSNTGGTDGAAVRWLIGEDSPYEAFRSMKHPHAYGCPAQYLDAYWYAEEGDNGGVHTNSGVGNKLCYLLTDGDEFGGYVIAGMGIPKVADLFYEVQTAILGSSADYYDLGAALAQAAINLIARDEGLAPGPTVWEAGDEQNVMMACYAVWIASSDVLTLRHFRATSIADDTRMALSWKNPDPEAGAFTGVDIWRKTGAFPNEDNMGTKIAGAVSGESAFDTGLTLGVEYFYAIVPSAGTQGSLTQYAKATAGAATPEPLSEAFTAGADLSFTQITFTPMADLLAAEDSGRPTDYVNFGDYGATVQTGVATLPVSDEDAVIVPLVDDGTVQFALSAPFPFFGGFYTDFLLSANGYVAPLPLALDATDRGPDDPWYLVVPTLETHFSIRRISPFFADLDPSSGGSIWARWMEDRFVLTFDHVPGFASLTTNTFQCELFYSGHVRFTFLELNAEASVVGLSDGKGVPLDPTDIVGKDVVPDVLMSDLSALDVPADLSLEPIPLQYVQEGDTVEFIAAAVSAVSPVSFTIENAPTEIETGATFVAVSGNAYQFQWETAESGSVGSYSFTIRASAAGVGSTSQDVIIYVSDVTQKPVATDLTISPVVPVDDDALIGNYIYSHLDGLPEGPTLIYWFRNNVHVPAFNALKTVPAAATTVGDTWYFRVTPATTNVGSYFFPSYIYGDTYQSDSVTILDNALKADANLDGQLNAVDVQVVVNGALGKDQPGMNPDVTRDGWVSAVDVQFVINEALLK